MQSKPFLKWAGGKSRIAEKIVSYFPQSGEFRRYFEPFLGSGAVYFEIAPQEGYLNDLNASLIATYETIKTRPERLICLLENIDEIYNNLSDLAEKEAFYYNMRSEYNSLSNNSSLFKSALFIFLNKAGWNGMYRENADGNFNIPFGKRKQLKSFDRQNILSISTNIANMKFTAVDYRAAVQKADKEDLVYFDPPYFPSSKTASFTAYQKGGFNDENQKELFDLALQLSKRGCFVAISNSDTKEARELYSHPDFHIRPISIMRTISSNSASRKKINEILVTNYKTN